MKIFIAGSFRLEEDKKEIRIIKSLLEKNGWEVWNAEDRIGSSYGTTSPEKIKFTVEIEKKEIKKSDVVVAVLRKATPGTMMELIFAYENKIPVIALIKEAEESIKISPWIKYHAKTVNNETEMLEELRRLIL